MDMEILIILSIILFGVVGNIVISFLRDILGVLEEIRDKYVE